METLALHLHMVNLNLNHIKVHQVNQHTVRTKDIILLHPNRLRMKVVKAIHIITMVVLKDIIQVLEEEEDIVTDKNRFLHIHTANHLVQAIVMVNSCPEGITLINNLIIINKDMVKVRVINMVVVNQDGDCYCHVNFLYLVFQRK